MPALARANVLAGAPRRDKTVRADQRQVHLRKVTTPHNKLTPWEQDTLLAMMQKLGVIASRSRPSVSNDNPYSESLFATLKHRALMPIKPFESIEQARKWAIGLVHWYNQEHRHSAIKFVTPQQRHSGQDTLLLQERDALYALARQKNPTRWSRHTRDWSRVTVVHLNPDKPGLKESKQ